MVKIKNKNIKIEDIIFWILIMAIVAICIWLLSGSPTLENVLITFCLFIVGSEIALWRKLFAIDKNTAVGFVKVDYDLKEKHNEIKNELKDIKNLIKKK